MQAVEDKLYNKMNRIMDVNDLKKPAMIAAVAAGTGFVFKKITKMSLGAGENIEGAVKAFLLITTAGGIVVWYDRS